MPRPSVLFVCVKNGGKSQIAAAMMRHLAGDRVEVHSAGTAPGTALNAEAQAAVAELGASMDGERPTAVDPALLAAVDRVVVLGSEAHVAPAAGMRGTVETWETDEPSRRGITGTERMRLVRDDITTRVRALLDDLVPAAGRAVRVFEPALCCSTGVCGPDLDQALVSFTADLDHLRGLGVDIARHNLANDPGAFVAEPVVRDFLELVGSDGLPLVVVDGVTVATGRYPSRQELLRYAGRVPEGASGSGPVQVLPAPQHRRDLGLSAATATGCC